MKKIYPQLLYCNWKNELMLRAGGVQEKENNQVGEKEEQTENETERQKEVGTGEEKKGGKRRGEKRSTTWQD